MPPAPRRLGCRRLLLLLPLLCTQPPVAAFPEGTPPALPQRTSDEACVATVGTPQELMTALQRGGCLSMRIALTESIRMRQQLVQVAATEVQVVPAPSAPPDVFLLVRSCHTLHCGVSATFALSHIKAAHHAPDGLQVAPFTRVFFNAGITWQFNGVNVLFASLPSLVVPGAATGAAFSQVTLRNATLFSALCNGDALPVMSAVSMALRTANGEMVRHSTVCRVRALHRLPAEVPTATVHRACKTPC